MPDRYGDRDDDDDDVIIDQTIVDFESRRLDRESIAAKQRADQHRKRLAETRSTHASLGSDQAAAIRRHRQQVTSTANERRRVEWISQCTLCNDDGYRPAGTICDHVDRSATHARGMALVRATMGWDDPNGPLPAPTPLPRQAPVVPQPQSGPAEPNPYPEWDSRAWGLTEPPEPEDC